ncbi:hypothetical protein [Nocardia brasiliensis]|uniref:hypothetical protein n=1 Tax=Nocardia brasiliensis TaxID=37326 RepID=UPI00245503A9|nr:hypothetical protein [Nocardia brasiliensis]
MKTGFVTEVHVVIYCDSCGDVYSVVEGEGTCFDSVHQAVCYLNAHSAGVGWLYDGDRVLCDACLATARCEEHGHSFAKPRVPARLLLTTPTPRACSVCGISEKEVQS